MNATLERRLDRALALSPMQLAFRWFNANRPAVLAYHGVDDPVGFERQIRFLVSEMCPVDLDALLEAASGGPALPPRAVLVTFDDGHPSIHDVALPILREYDVPAVAFVIAGLIGSEEPFWWDQAFDLVARGARASALDGADPAGAVRALKMMPDSERRVVLHDLYRGARGERLRVRQMTQEELLTLAVGGVEIGSHTLTHPCLDRCSDEVLAMEIHDAHERLAEALGRSPRAFAYPNGNADPRAVPLLERLGYQAAFMFDHRAEPFPPADRFKMSRLRVSSTDSLDRFRIVVSGLHPAIHRAIGRD